MKKRFLLLPALLFVCLLQAQNDGLRNFVEQHKSKPGFTFAFISKELLEVTLKSDIENKDWKQVQQFVRNIGSLSILVADKKVDGIALYKEAYDLVPTDEFSELLAVRDEQTSVRIWIKEAENLVSDLVLLVGSPEDFVLIHFTGTLDLSSVTSIAAMFRSSQAEDLVRKTEKAKVQFKVSPNPGKGDFQISYEAEDDAPVALTVIDQNGRQVSSLQLSGQPTEKVNLEHLAPGVYWMQLQTKQGKVGMQQVQIITYP